MRASLREGASDIEVTMLDALNLDIEFSIFRHAGGGRRGIQLSESFWASERRRSIASTVNAVSESGVCCVRSEGKRESWGLWRCVRHCGGVLLVRKEFRDQDSGWRVGGGGWRVDG